MNKLIPGEPPNWGTDSFSSLFATAEYNCRASAANLRPIFSLLGKMDSAFRRMTDAIEKDNKIDLLVPRFLLTRTHSAYFAACRLAMSGQHFESYPVIRAGIEQAWYALHISRNADHVETWLRRNDGVPETKKCKSQFKITNVVATHRSLDLHTARDFHMLYEMTIDYGAHPNQLGVLTALKSDTRGSYQVGILVPDITSTALALRMAVAMGVGVLKICQLIYPERFALTGLDLDVEKLKDELNSIFKPYRRGPGQKRTQ
jgi:hypothetical protein